MLTARDFAGKIILQDNAAELAIKLLAQIKVRS